MPAAYDHLQTLHGDLQAVGASWLVLAAGGVVQGCKRLASGQLVHPCQAPEDQQQMRVVAQHGASARHFRPEMHRLQARSLHKTGRYLPSIAEEDGARLELRLGARVSPAIHREMAETVARGYLRRRVPHVGAILSASPLFCLHR